MDAHPIYRWLTLMFMTVQIRLAPVNNALGKPLVTMISSLGGAILFPAAFLIGADSGLIGIAWAWLVAAPLLLPLSARLTAPRPGLSPSPTARATLQLGPASCRERACADGERPVGATQLTKTQT